MKKLFVLVLSLLLALIPAALAEEAADSGSVLAVDSAYMGLANMSPQFKGGESSDRGCLGLQPAAEADGAFVDAYMTFPVEVKTAGVYEITVRYAAKAKAGQTRCADLIVNDGERIHLPIVGQSDWNVYVDATVEVSLPAGKSLLTLKNVEGFDNSTYKAINVDFLAWTLISADEEPADAMKTVFLSRMKQECDAALAAAGSLTRTGSSNDLKLLTDIRCCLHAIDVLNDVSPVFTGGSENLLSSNLLSELVDLVDSIRDHIQTGTHTYADITALYTGLCDLWTALDDMQ